MEETETVAREFVILDSLDKFTDDELVDVQDRFEAETSAVLEEVRAENKRRAEAVIAAANARARRAGVTPTVQEPSDSVAPKRRGRKTNAEKAAEAKANGKLNESDEPKVDLDDEFGSATAGNA